jgi:hypothetical protein
VAIDHLEGSFPGGILDWPTASAMAGDLIAQLIIVPR